MIGLSAGLFAVACLWLLGRALMPQPDEHPASRLEQEAMALLLGLATLPAIAMLLGFLGIPLVGSIVWLLFLLGAASGFRRLRRDLAAPQAHAAGHGRWATGLLLLLGLGSAALTLAFPINEFDALYHFSFKGKALFFEGDPASSTFTDVGGALGRIHTHPSYPLLIPYLEAFQAHLAGSWDGRWVQTPLAFWALLLPAAASFGLRPRGRRTARWAALLAAGLPILYVRDFLYAHGEGVLEKLRESSNGPSHAGIVGTIQLGGGGDLALAAFVAGALAWILRARRSGRLDQAAAAGLCMAGAAFAKNEGLGLLGVWAIAMLLAMPFPFRRWLRTGGVALAVALVALSPWLLHRSAIPSVDEDYPSRLQPSNVWGHVINQERQQLLEQTAGMSAEELEFVPISDEPLYHMPAEDRPRLLEVLFRFQREFLHWHDWGILWPLLLGALLLGGAWWKQEEERLLFWFLLGALALYGLILLVTPWPLPQLRTTGIPGRLFLHLAAPAVMLLATRLARRA